MHHQKRAVPTWGPLFFLSRLFVVHDPITALVLERGEGGAFFEIGLFVVAAVAVLVVCLVVAGHRYGFAGFEFLHFLVLPPINLSEFRILIPFYVILVKMQILPLIS